MSDHPSLRFLNYEVCLDAKGKPHELGRGGMGITYKARDAMLRREVALKVISPSLFDDDNFKALFLREARSAASLNHRNVAQIYQVGEDEGRFFYAMEFIQGETAADYLAHARTSDTAGISLKDVLDIGIQVVRALCAAEKRQLVHRDIKPSNIMLTVDHDGKRLVKLIDFGLAKPVQTAGEQTAFVSQAGFLGTPVFASPEQILSEKVDIRSDIYSLGATLWHLLEGRPPFQSQNDFEVCRMHIQDLPPVERLRALGLPEGVVALVAAMLQKKPDSRPASALDLEQRLTACWNDLADAAVADTRRIEQQGLPGRASGPHHYIVWPLTAAVIIVALAATAGLMWRAMRAREPAAAAGTAVPSPDTGPHAAVGPPAAGVAPRPAAQPASDGATLPAVSSMDAAREALRSAERYTQGAEEPRDIPKAEELYATAADLFEKEEAWAEAMRCHLAIVALATDSAQTRHARHRLDWMVENFRLSATGFGGEAYASCKGTLEQMAEQGDVPAMLVLGQHERAADAALAGRWMRAAASAYAEGKTVARDADEAAAAYETAAFLYEKASDWAGAAACHVALLQLVGGGERYARSRARMDSILAGLRDRLPGFTEEMFQRSMESIETLAAAGDEKAMALLAQRLREGRPQEALKWQRAAAEHYAQTARWDKAIGAQLDIAAWYPDERAAAVGALGALLQSLLDDEAAWGEADIRNLKPLLEQAAELPVVQAMLLLGRQARSTDPTECARWYMKAAQAGSAAAMLQTGLRYSNGAGLPKDLGEAIHWFERADEAGHLPAKVALADAYLNGTGVPQDRKKAYDLLCAAAEGGHAGAMDMLATCLHRGWGTPVDDARAVELYRQAAAKGYVGAYANLGVMYMTGTAVDRDPAEAVRLWQRGIQLKDPACMFFLAGALHEGLGTSTNDTEARRWFVEAAQAGHAAAQAWCKREGLAFTPPQ